MEGVDEAEPGGAGPRSQSPFCHLRARAAHLRKSISADNHLDMNCDDGSGTAAAEDKPARGSKAKLKRKFVSPTFPFASARRGRLDAFLAPTDDFQSG